ncbi:macrophage-expressed gene 1 protein-like [Acipenser ruthenus]|uniref:macrophage-expressed gene 1 protein-like n=1 Tax=Acipenser ruthenus TaxID=7906 RepID=UPI002741EF33|nr:macrophage-expressed gene 1 protein-like [Acipenser ruthenus]
MHPCAFTSLLLLLLISAAQSQNAAFKSISGFLECKKALNVSALEVLPGGGWDNLRNVDMGRVMNFNYSQCQTTEDGVYLIPDEVFAVPEKQSKVESSSEIIESWLEHRSSVAHSVNAEVSYLSAVNGKFSTENQRVKTHQVRDRAVTTRVQVRNFMYSVKANPDFTFDSRFRKQVQDIANALENNQTRMANYLSEMLVLNYGTHVLTSVDAGASLVQEDYLQSSFVSDAFGRKSSISASAGVNFFNKVNIGVGGSSSQEDTFTQQYVGNTTYSLTESHGGVPFYPGITLQKWQENIANNLVAIDRSGLPLHFFLTRETLPGLPEPTIRKLSKTIDRAIRTYYLINTRPGCVRLDSPNFNFEANVDDGSCEGAPTNFTFGGVFQNCTELSSDAGGLCQALEQKNPLTGGYSCPAPYQAVKLRTEEKEEGYSHYECSRHCHGCWLLFECCQDVCGEVYRIRKARFNAFWCVAAKDPVPEDSGYLFGGLYGSSSQNPLTKTSSCPFGFVTLKLLDGLRVCVSDDYEQAARNSVPFGGLFSCEVGNPLSEGSRQSCPKGFSQHLAAISNGCQVLYCVRSGEFTGGQLLPVRLPPFIRKPLVSYGSTNTVIVMSEGEMSWIKDAKSQMWKIAKPEDLQRMTKLLDGQREGLSGGAVFGVVFGVLVSAALVVGLAVYGIKRRRSRGYGEIRETSDGERSERAVGGESETQMENETGSSDPSRMLLA